MEREVGGVHNPRAVRDQTHFLLDGISIICHPRCFVGWVQPPPCFKLCVVMSGQVF